MSKVYFSKIDSYSNADLYTRLVKEHGFTELSVKIAVLVFKRIMTR